jgi:hypothetical protein
MTRSGKLDDSPAFQRADSPIAPSIAESSQTMGLVGETIGAPTTIFAISFREQTSENRFMS